MDRFSLSGRIDQFDIEAVPLFFLRECGYRGKQVLRYLLPDLSASPAPSSEITREIAPSVKSIFV